MHTSTAPQPIPALPDKPLPLYKQQPFYRYGTEGMQGAPRSLLAAFVQQLHSLPARQCG